MPSPIFEFRCAVHGSPSVIYHPTENLRIRSACSRLCYTEPSLLLGFFLFHSKRKLGISCKTFTVSVKAQITHWNSSCSSCVAARYSNKSDEIPTSSSAWNLKHNHILDWGEEKAKFNLILKINEPSQSFHSAKEITKIVFGSGCNISVRPLPSSGHFQTPLQSQSAYFPQIRWGWDGTGPHVCRVPVTRLRGYQSRIEPAETDSDSSVRVRVIWLVPLTRLVRGD